MMNYLFSRRTKKGGGKINNKRLRLKPIMRLLKRRVLWMLGVSNKMLDAHSEEKEFGLNNLLPNFHAFLENEKDDELFDDDYVNFFTCLMCKTLKLQPIIITNKIFTILFHLLLLHDTFNYLFYLI